MKKTLEPSTKFTPSPTFSKTAREWILASALYDGIEDEDIRQIEMLLSERGANPNVLLPEYGITPFHLVVANESTRFAVKATDLCLQHGADPNVRSEDGLTPVHLAAMWGCSEVLHVLLASGGNPWLVDGLNLNAFDYALVEKQERCHEILKTSCNSQPRSFGTSRSPYQLNLKRVILYKNDLQIVYEASPTSGQKSTFTQTSPTGQKQFAIEEVAKDVCEKNTTPKNEHKDNRLIRVNRRNTNRVTCKNDETPLSSRLREIIEKHRRNSVLFEYAPSNEKRDSLSSGIVSCMDVDNSNEVLMGAFSELVTKLDQTKKIRQSLKPSFNSSDMMKNITHRKKPLSPPTYDKSKFSDKSCQYETPQNEIGFILSDLQKDSPGMLGKPPTVIDESPPSIGFILDNINWDNDTRNSSLFSDIGSDIEVFSTPGKEDNIESIMTEDEKSPKTKNLDGMDANEIRLAENSSGDSLYPYVSCENTRQRDSFEDFTSCRGSNSYTAMDKRKKEPPAIVDVLNDYFKLHVITSTPERSENSIDGQVNEDERLISPISSKVVSKNENRLSAGSDEVSFVSAAGDQIEKSGQCESGKRTWVEANVASSSDDEPYMSISEEYEYTDMDEGVVLIEKRYLPKDMSLSNGESKKKNSQLHRQSSSSECESVSTVSGSDRAYDTDELRRALCQHGFVPGPITCNTKRVYLRKLKRCRRKPLPPPQMDTNTPVYSPELMKTLSKPCEHLLAEWSHLEDSMSASFSCARRPWREGQAKTSFTYLLLDPRIAHSLPTRAILNHDMQTLWRDFLRAVFYVGKGKRSRPYAHLYKAVSLWQQHNTTFSCKKIRRILDIWKSGEGVVCLHVFLNVIPVEAFTREAAMISALTLPRLTNEKAGEFYGSAASWSLRLKRRLGCVLLHRAFKVFLAEGERQLRPADID